MNFLLPTLIACATCKPDPTSEVGQAASMTLLFMLGVLALILGLITKIFLNLARRERQFLQSQTDLP